MELATTSFHRRPSAGFERSSRVNRGSTLKSFCDIFRWTHWRQMSQLHQDTQIVAWRPALNDFAVGESEHLHSGGSNGPAGRWLSHITARIGRGRRVATHNNVVLRNHRFDLNSQIRKHRPQHGHDSFDIFWASGGKWIAWVVAHILGCNNLVSHRKVTLPPQFLAPTASHCFVLFYAHGPSFG